MLLNIPSYHSNLCFKCLIFFPLTFYNFELLERWIFVSSLTHFVVVVTFRHLLVIFLIKYKVEEEAVIKFNKHLLKPF